MFCIVTLLVRESVTLATNGPRIGDSGGLESQNFQFCTKLSNSLLLFSKFIKKRKYKRLLRQKKEKLTISPLSRHFANTMLGVVLFNLPNMRKIVVL
ncbi:MAG: hypothetical protein EAS52_15290 [Parapedobacter sp.]|nr:MAG: hypothetical protein EAS52_15290 [Parapedobacter sp.]